MNYQVLLLLIGALVVLSAAKDLRIKGARPAKATEFPSMAAISDKEGFVGHGIILSKRVIMAPASTLTPAEMTVRVGSVEWANGGQVVEVKNILQTEFVSFIVLANDLVFGPTVKAVKFTDQITSEEFTKLQLVGWGYPSSDDDVVTDRLYVQNLPVLNQEDCQNQYEELFAGVPEHIPLYCVSETSTYGMFDEAVVPVFRNGAVEAFAIGRDEEANSILLIHAGFVYHEMKMTLNAMQAIQ